MSAYPDYAEVPLPWLPNIPAHWKLVRNKNIFVEVKDVVGDNADAYPLLSLTTQGIILRDVASGKGKFPKDFNTYKVVEQGDMVFCLFDIDETPRTVGLSQYNGMLTGAYTIFHVTNINPRYVYYYYLSLDNVKAMRPLYNGLRKTINTGTFLSCKLPVPPRPEQDQIVRFLDWKISSINKLIGTKKKQLATVQELINTQFQLISAREAQSTRLKHIVSLCNDFIEIDPAQYYIKTGMYNRGRGIFRREAISGKDMGDSSFQKICSGCVMISGQFAWEAATYITTEEDEAGVVSHRYYLLAPKKEVPSEYIWCFLMSDYGQMQMKLCSHGAAGRNRPLNIKELLNVYIPMPHLDSELNALVRNVKNLIQLRKNILAQESLLTEVRTRLISDVVTGKIDVQGIEIPEYEFVDEASSDKDVDEIPEEQEELENE